MNSLRRALAVAALSLSATALPVAVIAQPPAQTQEGAVRFMDLFAAQQQPPMAHSTSFDKLDIDTRLRKPIPAAKWIKVAAYDSEHPCQADLKDSEGHVALIDWDKSRVYFHKRSDWSEAMLASDYGPLIKPIIEIRKDGSSYVIWPADEAQGARLFRAMQFLVESCDPMKATGF